MDRETIHFHRLSFVAEGADVVVGRPDLGEYVVLPHDGAELLRQLTEGMTTTDAERWYQDTFDEPVDLDDFVLTLDELGFTRPAGTTDTPVAVPRLRRLARAVFSPAALTAYAVLVLVCGYLLVRHPGLRPRPSMIYFSASLVSIQLLILFGQLPLAFLHESFHVLALRRLGLASQLSISNRFAYVVFETQSNGLLSLPRHRRYLPLLAGMLIDVVAFCALDLTAWNTRSADGSFSLAGRVCLALSFTIVTRLGWQFLLYLQTDLYYVLATALNCQDLHDASTAIFTNRIRRLTGRHHRLVDEDQWTGRDRRIGRWYGLFIAVGYTTAAAMIVFVSIPIMWIYLERATAGLFSGGGDAPFWDSVLSVVLILINVALPIVLARRKRRTAARRPRLLTDNSGVM